MKKLLPTGLGAEPKKLVAVGVLLLTAGVLYWWMNQPDVPSGANVPAAAAPRTAPLPNPPVTTRPATSSARTTTRGRSGSNDDFRPTLKLPEGTDLSRIDPTLKLEPLAKVRNVTVEAGSRSLFEFYTPPPPPVPKPPPIVPRPMQVTETRPTGPITPPPPPPPPPIPLKFYGYSGALRSNVRRAFFLDGEDIVQAGENEMIRNRYKIVRIGVNSAVVEDTVAKNQQTLALAEEAQ